MNHQETIQMVIAKKRNRGYAIIAAVTICLICAHAGKTYKDMQALKETYLREQKIETRRIGSEIENKFSYLYQSLRTMAFLPGVRSIDRYGKRFGENEKTTFQQIYNNAYLNIKLSEIYILPKTLNPEKIDPATKKPEAPILTFDQFITGAGNEKKEETEGSKLEQVEIEEYRVMREQLNHFAKYKPTLSKADGIEIPALSAKPVITCDNSEFTKEDLAKGDDFKRMGVVYTVPVYDLNNHFSGAVSAVVRLGVLANYFPTGSFKLVQAKTGLSLAIGESKELRDSEKFLSNEKSNPSLIYNEALTLKINDSSSWQLWVAKSDQEFWSKSEVKGAIGMFFGGLFAILALGGILFWQNKKDSHLFENLTKVIAELVSTSQTIATLSEQVDHIASELKSASGQQASATQETAASTDEIGAMAKKTEQNTGLVQTSVEASRTATAKGADLVKQMVTTMHELSENTHFLIQQITNSNERIVEVVRIISNIGDKTKLINDIVFQTKLLSFNASVEAARAGEHGRGFAVVAEEVGKLAKLSGDSAKEIHDLLTSGIQRAESTVQEVKTGSQQAGARVRSSLDTGNEVVKACGTSFAEIVAAVDDAAQMTSEIASAVVEQSHGVTEIIKAMTLISGTANQTLSLTQNVESISSTLSSQTQVLSQLGQQLQTLIGIPMSDSQTANETERHQASEPDHESMAA